MKYDQVRADFESLERIAPLDDTVTIMAEVEDLMRDPTKSRAARMYRDCIGLWFTEHEVTKETEAIAHKYGIYHPQ